MYLTLTLNPQFSLYKNGKGLQEHLVCGRNSGRLSLRSAGGRSGAKRLKNKVFSRRCRAIRSVFRTRKPHRTTRIQNMPD
jgi:hypothetical protein